MFVDEYLTNLWEEHAHILMHDFHEELCQTVFLATDSCVCRYFLQNNVQSEQLLDLVFVISGIIKVSESVISLC